MVRERGKSSKYLEDDSINLAAEAGFCAVNVFVRTREEDVCPSLLPVWALTTWTHN